MSFIYDIIFQTTNCETNFGCFRDPSDCTGDDCVFLITYVLTPNMPGYLDVSMQTTKNWVALGHNTQRGMVCKTILLKSVSSVNSSKYLRKTLSMQ